MAPVLHEFGCCAHPRGRQRPALPWISTWYTFPPTVSGLGRGSVRCPACHFGLPMTSAMSCSRAGGPASASSSPPAQHLPRGSAHLLDAKHHQHMIPSPPRAREVLLLHNPYFLIITPYHRTRHSSFNFRLRLRRFLLPAPHRARSTPHTTHLRRALQALSTSVRHRSSLGPHSRPTSSQVAIQAGILAYSASRSRQAQHIGHCMRLIPSDFARSVEQLTVCCVRARAEEVTPPPLSPSPLLACRCQRRTTSRTRVWRRVPPQGHLLPPLGRRGGRFLALVTCRAAGWFGPCFCCCVLVPGPCLFIFGAFARRLARIERSARVRSLSS